MAETKELCYETAMLKAYVGIACKHGLSALRAERPETLTWAGQSAASKTWPPNVAFWAVLPDQEALRISWLLVRGHRREALAELNRAAREMGRILPSDKPTRH